MTDAGDCLRMAVAFIDEAYGQRLESAYLLSRAVAGAATASDEQAVCATQLQWWHEELERLQRGEARHPLAQAFAERVGLEEDTPTFTREWLVDAERQLVGPPPEDEASHRVTGFRRYGSALMLAVGPEVREAAGSAIRETSVALYALDALLGESPAFEYDTAMALHDSLVTEGAKVADVGVAVLAATAANAMRRRYDGLRPGAVRQLRFAWRSARRARKTGATA